MTFYEINFETNQKELEVNAWYSCYIKLQCSESCHLSICFFTFWPCDFDHVMTIYRHFYVIFNFAFSIFIFTFFCFVNHRNCNKRVLFCTFCSLSRFPTIDHSEPFLSIHDYHVTNPNCSKSISFKTKSPNQKNHFMYISQIKSGLGQWRNSDGPSRTVLDRVVRGLDPCISWVPRCYLLWFFKT